MPTIRTIITLSRRVRSENCGASAGRELTAAPPVGGPDGAAVSAGVEAPDMPSASA